MDVIRKVASPWRLSRNSPDRFEGWWVALPEIAVIAISQATSALSFIVPKPQAFYAVHHAKAFMWKQCRSPWPWNQWCCQEG